ncbi:hypothetical protein LOD99_8226 [Oopsacas minuta]|uniref:Transposase n=1 Tax=Oopsacas minuta TaxID=111878 RepID=A0AAV7JHU7_9METZ|nr:hypothetical protein LOD99_8226 [Oopsacas minuta]
MVASFISKKGHVATIPLIEQKTVTASWYVNICMPQVIEKWSILHPKAYLTSLQWHHDNTSAHKAALTMDFFAENGIKLIPLPAYSPDLAPCDFFLFPKLKKKIEGIHFNGARLVYNEALQDITKEDWENCFESWFRRMDLCIQSSDSKYFFGLPSYPRKPKKILSGAPQLALRGSGKEKKDVPL